MTAIRLIGDRVLVALPPKDTEQDAETGYTFNRKGESESGIILAKPTEEYDVECATRGIVMQLGKKTGQVLLEAVIDKMREIAMRRVEGFTNLVDAMNELAPAPFDVAVGDCVVFARSAGDQFTLDGISYVILREADILGVVAPVSEAA